MPKQLNPYLEGKIYSLTVESYNFLAGVRNTLRFTETDVTFPVIDKMYIGCWNLNHHSKMKIWNIYSHTSQKIIITQKVAKWIKSNDEINRKIQ